MTELVLGTLMDLVGRKIPSITGLVIAGTGTLLFPVPHRLVGLYFCRVAIDVGILPIEWSPYGVDYFHGESLGLYCGYMQVLT